MSKKKKTITIKPEDGAILFKKDSDNPEPMDDFIIPDGEDWWCQQVRRTIAFFIYATQREDWIEEFEEKIPFTFFELVDLEPGKQKKKTKEKKETKEKKYKHLKVIK
tara:strand:+ start:465 stop:785 length:321 start_codon:yes stop_codon:yes gene_type:complete